MWKRLGLSIFCIVLLMACAAGNSFGATEKVHCILPDNDNGESVLLSESQCRKLSGVIDTESVDSAAQAAATQTASVAVPPPVSAPVAPPPPAPAAVAVTGAYQVRCWQSSLFGGYWRYVFLSYIPPQPIRCPEPGFAYSYAPVPYGAPTPYGYGAPSGLSIRFRFGGHHHHHG